MLAHHITTIHMYCQISQLIYYNRRFLNAIYIATTLMVRRQFAIFRLHRVSSFYNIDLPTRQPWTFTPTSIHSIGIYGCQFCLLINSPTNNIPCWELHPWKCLFFHFTVWDTIIVSRAYLIRLNLILLFSNRLFQYSNMRIFHIVLLNVNWSEYPVNLFSKSLSSSKQSWGRTSLRAWLQLAN